MRHIDRAAIPEILARNGAEWLRKFDEDYTSGKKKRPSARTYNHPDVIRRLLSMSHHKCAYCESPIKGLPKEIDHFIEISVDHKKAFEWNNLYPACVDCNRKKQDEHAIPTANTLDPCADSDDTIRENLTFEAEQIKPVPGSSKGDLTIRKYDLDSERNDLKRSRCLQKLSEELCKIMDKMRVEGRSEPSESERGKLRLFMDAYAPYSLMCEIFLNNNWKYYI